MLNRFVAVTSVHVWSYQYSFGYQHSMLLSFLQKPQGYTELFKKQRKQSSGMLRLMKTFLLITCFLNKHIFTRLKFQAEVDLRGFNLATLYLLFQTNCNVRDQLLSFYMKNVFSHLGVGSDKLYIISAFQVLQANMNACVSIFLRARLTLFS